MVIELNTENREYITWQYEQLNFALLGGLKIEGLERMRVTLKVEYKQQAVRHNLDLYNNESLDKLIRRCTERFALGTSYTATAPGLWVADFPNRTAEENARGLGYATWKGLELYGMYKLPEIFTDAEVTTGAIGYDAKLLRLDNEIPTRWNSPLTDGLKFRAYYNNEMIGFWKYSNTKGLEIKLNLDKNLRGSGLGSKFFEWALTESEADVFTATWVRSDIYEGGISTKLQQYEANLAKKQTVQDAAWNTWSGRQAKKHGFKHVEESSIKNGVSAKFAK